MQLMLFLGLRVRKSAEVIEKDRCLRQIRSALMGVMAYAVEVFLFVSSSEMSSKDPLAMLYGAGGKRKCYGQKWWRQRLMAACRAVGSSDAIGRLVLGVHSASAMCSMARIH